MKSFLFVQWKNPTDPSRFVIDGIVSEYSGTELQDGMMKILANVPKYKEIRSNNSDKDLSPSFRCSYVNTKTSVLNFVEGNFEETACSGRKLVYIFATYENDSNVIAQNLKEYASLLGVSPNSKDLEEIQLTEFKKKRKKINKIILCVTITIVILLLLFTLLNLQSK